MYLIYVTSQISLLKVSVIVFSNKWLSLTLFPKAPLKFKTSRFQVKTATKRTSSMVYDSLEIHQVCVWCLLTNTMEKITKCDPNPHVLHILAHTKAYDTRNLSVKKKNTQSFKNICSPKFCMIVIIQTSGSEVVFNCALSFDVPPFEFK